VNEKESDPEKKHPKYEGKGKQRPWSYLWTKVLGLIKFHASLILLAINSRSSIDAHFSEEPLVNSPISKFYTKNEWQQTMRYFSAYDPTTFVGDKRNFAYNPFTRNTRSCTICCRRTSGEHLLQDAGEHLLQDDMVDLVTEMLDYARENAEEEESVSELPTEYVAKKRLPLAKDHVFQPEPKGVGVKGRCSVCKGERQVKPHPVRNGCRMCGLFCCCAECFAEAHSRNVKNFEQYW
jgi:hypothetical protein